ncbi:hypothetical protein ACFFQF_31825 [Haladaptatus pallidirubidus]
MDTHTHAWGRDTNELPWEATILPPGWTGSYTAHDLVADMDAASVEESVIVSTPLYGRGLRANEYTMRAIEAYPERLWGLGSWTFSVILSKSEGIFAGSSATNGCLECGCTPA